MSAHEYKHEFMPSRAIPDRPRSLLLRTTAFVVTILLIHPEQRQCPRGNYYRLTSKPFPRIVEDARNRSRQAYKTDCSGLSSRIPAYITIRSLLGQHGDDRPGERRFFDVWMPSCNLLNNLGDIRIEHILQISRPQVTSAQSFNDLLPFISIQCLFGHRDGDSPGGRSEFDVFTLTPPAKREFDQPFSLSNTDLVNTRSSVWILLRIYWKPYMQKVFPAESCNAAYLEGSFRQLDHNSIWTPTIDRLRWFLDTATNSKIEINKNIFSR